MPMPGGSHSANRKSTSTECGQWKSDVINGLTGGLGRLVTQRKITHVRATAQFKDDHTLSLTDSEGKIGTLGFDHAILATGSRAVDIPMFPADSDRIWNSKKALDLKAVPKTLLVVGGGYIGLELGSVYAALGSDVTVVEMLPHLLAGADRDLVRFLAKTLKDRFKAILARHNGGSGQGPEKRRQGHLPETGRKSANPIIPASTRGRGPTSQHRPVSDWKRPGWRSTRTVL
jgi:dihydrolipoamide dehydrogenase